MGDGAYRADDTTCGTRTRTAPREKNTDTTTRSHAYRVDLPRVEGLGVREGQRQQLLGLGDVGALAEVVVAVGLDRREDLAVHVERRLSGVQQGARNRSQH